MEQREISIYLSILVLENEKNTLDSFIKVCYIASRRNPSANFVNLNANLIIYTLHTSPAICVMMTDWLNYICNLQPARSKEFPGVTSLLDVKREN